MTREAGMPNSLMLLNTPQQHLQQLQMYMWPDWTLPVMCTRPASSALFSNSEASSFETTRPIDDRSNAPGIGDMARQTPTGLSQGFPTRPLSFLQMHSFTRNDRPFSTTAETFS